MGRYEGRYSRGFPPGSNIGLIELIPYSPADNGKTSYDFHSGRMLIASHDNTDKDIKNLHIHNLFCTFFHGYFLFLLNSQ